MQINKYHGTYNRTKRTAAIKYIVIHYTGGTGSAKNNCIYFAGGDRNSSADYFIDDSGIWEYNDPAGGYYTWHCGGGTRYNSCTNGNSIGIETVSNGSAFTSKEIGYLTEIVTHLMSTYGIDADHVVRHYDCNHKQCPAPYIDASKWAALKSTITSNQAKSEEEDMPTVEEIWSYPINGTQARDRLQGVDEAVNTNRSILQDTSDPTGRGKEMTTHDHVKWIAATVSDISERLAAIEEKLGE